MGMPGVTWSAFELVRLLPSQNMVEKLESDTHVACALAMWSF